MWVLRNGVLTPSKVRLHLSRVTVFHFDPGRLDEPQLTQRYFAQTVHRVTQQSQSRNRPVFPATVVVIVVRRLTRFSSKDSLLRNGALTPSKARLQLSRVTVFHFDPGRLDETQLTQRYFVFQSNHGCTDYKRNKSAYEFIRK